MRLPRIDKSELVRTEKKIDSHFHGNDRGRNGNEIDRRDACPTICEDRINPLST